MSLDASRGGSGPLSAARRFQLLRLGVEVRADPSLAGIDFLTQNAVHPFGPDETAVYEVRAEGLDWVIARDGAECRRLPGPDAAGAELFARVHADALTSLPGHALVRGVLGAVAGRRFLLIGERGAGLTSLAVRLLYSGAAVEGDAFAVLGDDGLTAMARRFCLRAGASELLPEVAGMLDRLPRLRNGPDDVIWGFDPHEAGFEWRLRQGPVDLCVAVEPNHGGRTRAAPCAHYEMARRLMTRCSAPRSGGPEWLRRATALADGASCWTLQLGDLDDAVETLRGLV